MNSSKPQSDVHQSTTGETQHIISYTQHNTSRAAGNARKSPYQEQMPTQQVHQEIPEAVKERHATKAPSLTTAAVVLRLI